MADRYPTQKVFSMAWPKWDDVTGKPDLSPSHINALLRNERAALEYAANMLLSSKSEEDYDVDQPLDDLIYAAFNLMDSDSLKTLNKTFKLVTDEFYTLEFVHPTKKFPVFRAYAYPLLGMKLVMLYTNYLEQGQEKRPATEDTVKVEIEVEESVKEVQEIQEVPHENVKPTNLDNCCGVLAPDYNIPICLCPVNGEMHCSHWMAPEDPEQRMCEHQTANEEAKGADDLIACTCEEAVTELEEFLAEEARKEAQEKHQQEKHQQASPKKRGRPRKSP